MSDHPSAATGAEGAAFHRPFRARAARLVATLLAVAVLMMVGAIALLLPGPVQGQVGGMGLSVADRVGVVLFGLAVAWFLMRHASVRADPDDGGLTVRNLILTRRVEWAEIVSVRFGAGRPWVQLDLADGTTHAVMAVQSADGAHAAAEARRLATLVARHSRTSRDD